MKKKIYIVFISALSFFSLSPVYAKTKVVTCGKIKELPYKVLQLSNTGINIIQIIVPIILVVMGAIDFLKAISSQKEDDIKKAQSTFIKRLIMGALVYFIIVIVKFIISIIGNDDSIWGCVECFVVDAGNCN